MKIYIGTMIFLLVAVIAFGCMSQAYETCQTISNDQICSRKEEVTNDDIEKK